MALCASGGPGHHPDAPATRKTSATVTQHDRPHGTSGAAVLVALATVLLGGPSAVLDRLLVDPCPTGCGYVHICHIPAGAWRRCEPIVRAPRCAPHRRMQLQVVDVLPAVPAL